MAGFRLEVEAASDSDAKLVDNDFYSLLKIMWEFWLGLDANMVSVGAMLSRFLVCVFFIFCYYNPIYYYCSPIDG